MSQWHPTTGAAGSPVGLEPDRRPTLDFLLPHLRPELRPALLPPPPPPRTAAPDATDRLALPPGEWPAFDPAPLSDPSRHPAIAAALGCPDLYLIATPAGPTPEGCLLAVVDEAARRGERLLVLAPTPAAADRLAALLDAPDRPVVRAGDPADGPSHRSARAHGAGLVEDTRRALEESVREAEGRLARWDALAVLWSRVRTPAGPADDPADAADRAARQTDLVALREQVKQLTPLTDAKRGGRLLSGSYWRAVLAGDVTGKQAELEGKIREAEDALRAIDARAERRATAARDADFRRLCDELHATGIVPPADPSGVDAAEAAVAAARQQTDAGLAFTRRRLAELTGDPAAAAARFLARVRVVVADPATAADPAVSAARFDRLIIESSESVSESDFRTAARHADRWILSGCLKESDYHFMNGTLQVRRNGSHNAAGVFTQWWDRLHRPVWQVEGGRLVCRLADAPRHTLTSEPCADRPEVELRFGTLNGAPVVAEIAFPDASPDAAAEAKAFLARELGEVRLNPLGTALWVEDGGRLTVAWPAAGDCGFGTDLGAGLCEYAVVVDGVPVTTRVVFDPAAGWDRPAAEQWVERHTVEARTARTARLPGATAPASAEPAEACLV